MGVDVNSMEKSGMAAALEIASAADVIILAVGIDQSVEFEGGDRTDTALPGLQEEFALKVLALNKPTVLILVNGGALAIDNILQNSNTPNAIIEAYNPSVSGAEPLAAHIFGTLNRWGRLSTTLYSHSFINEIGMTDYNMAPTSTGKGRTYKYYTGQPLFHFGYGLSYSTFSLNCVMDGSIYKLHCSVENSGPLAGDEVLLVYHSVGDEIRKRIDHPAPIKSLVQFGRVRTQVGETVEIDLQLEETAFLLVNKDGVRTKYSGYHEISICGSNDNCVSFKIIVNDGKEKGNLRVESQ